MGFYRIDVPGPVLLLVVPGQLVAPDFVRAVIVGIEAAAEAHKSIPILPDPVHIQRGHVVFFHPAACDERTEIVPGPLIDPVVIGGEVGKFRIGPADCKKTVRVSSDDCTRLVSGHNIVRDGCNGLCLTGCRAHRGKTIDRYHDTNQRPGEGVSVS